MVAFKAAPYAGVARIRFLGSSSLSNNFELSAIGLPCVGIHIPPKGPRRQVMLKRGRDEKDIGLAMRWPENIKSRRLGTSLYLAFKPK